MTKKKNVRGAPTAGKVSKNQRDVSSSKGKSQPSAQAMGAVEPGTYDVPGGTITVDAKGMSKYEGTPYQVVRLRKRYRVYTNDRDAQGKIKTKMGK